MSTQCDRPYQNYTVFGSFPGLKANRHFLANRCRAGKVRTTGSGDFVVFHKTALASPRPAGLECLSEVATMMTDPAFAIKNTVQQLVDVQIDTLRKPSPLTSSELDEYRSRSERISALYEQLDLIVRKRFHARSQTAA